jgi:hypothetical protein
MTSLIIAPTSVHVPSTSVVVCASASVIFTAFMLSFIVGSSVSIQDACSRSPLSSSAMPSPMQSASPRPVFSRAPLPPVHASRKKAPNDLAALATSALSLGVCGRGSDDAGSSSGSVTASAPSSAEDLDARAAPAYHPYRWW